MPGLFYSLANKNLQLFLEAQATKNRVRTLSAPKLLAMENQEAKVVIGNSTGYLVTTTINQVTTQSVQFLESGVILRVTPSVDQLGRVMLKVHPASEFGHAQCRHPRQKEHGSDYRAAL